MSEMYLCIYFPFLKGAIIHRSGVIALCEAYGRIQPTPVTVRVDGDGVFLPGKTPSRPSHIVTLCFNHERNLAPIVRSIVPVLHSMLAQESARVDIQLRG